MARPKMPDHWIKHGTVAGYRAERRRGMETCEACREAERERDRKRKREKRAYRDFMRRAVKLDATKLTPEMKAEADEWIAWLEVYAKASLRHGARAGGSGSSSTTRRK